MTPDDVALEAIAETENLEDNLQAMFPEFNVRARYNKNLGGSVLITFWGPDPVNNIAENSETHMKLMMHLSDNKAQPTVPESFDVEKLIVPRELKYRKIKGKSVEEALAKVERWFKKNRDEIYRLEGMEPGDQ